MESDHDLVHDVKIAVWHNLPSGGAKRALCDQVRGLLGRGHQVEAWCPPTADQTYLPLGELIREHVVPLSRPMRTNWDKRLRIPARVGPQLAGMEEHCRACANAISAGGFDILFAHPCQFFAVTSIGRLVSLPKAIYLQEPFRALYEAMPRLPWLAPPRSQHSLMSLDCLRGRSRFMRESRNARIQGREEVRNAAAFDRILVNSMFSRESILRSYGLDAEVCYLGTDLTLFADLGRARENLLVGLGSFTPSKNIRLVIEAVALLKPPRPPLAWIGNATGGNDYLGEMKALAEARNVRFTPYLRIPDAEIVALLNRASALVYAPRLEPFGYAVLEAGGCALPAIAVAEGGVRETVKDGETGILTRSTPRSVADAIDRLLSDPALARRLGIEARANAERCWSLDASIDRIELALRDVIASMKPRQPLTSE